LRLRLPDGARGADVEECLRRQSGVTSSQVSPRTGSVLVQYRPEKITVETLLRSVAPVLGTVLAAPPRWTPAVIPPLAQTLKEKTGDVNAAVDRLMGGHADVRVLIALALIAWAIIGMLRGRPGARQALWYAYKLFLDYRPQDPAVRETRGAMLDTPAMA